MKSFALVACFIFSAAAAHAQLDQILAPIAEKTGAEKLDQSALVPADSAAQTSVAADPAAGHRDLTSDQVLEELQHQLSSYFGLKGDLRLSYLHDWGTLRLPGKDFALTITDYPPDGVTSSFALRFKITSGGAPVGDWQLGLRAQLWQSVWVSQGRLDKGQALDRTLLNSQKVDILREKQTLISDDVDPSGYDVAAGITAGRPISKQDVVERPVIHRGDVVDVIATHGLLDIHMKALALQDGGINSLIKMRNLDSTKDFNAQILNDNEVKVHF